MSSNLGIDYDERELTAEEYHWLGLTIEQANAEACCNFLAARSLAASADFNFYFKLPLSLLRDEMNAACTRLQAGNDMREQIRQGASVVEPTITSSQLQITTNDDGWAEFLD